MALRLSSSAVSLGIELMKAGNKMLHLSSSTKGIIKSLVQTENILSRIQLLSISIIKPLHVIREALIAEDLVRHFNMAVKISVACCICEIMRIMAPNTPYDDNQMKEFFELAVTVFENVSSSSGESYTKMIKVIETLSSGEFVVIMCHLQLDGLIVGLFKRFLTAVGSTSSDVVSKMEKIMTMIIKESKELPRELVNLLAMNGESSKEIASPGRVQLAKKVLKNYVDQLNPDILDATVSEKKTLAIIETPMPSKSVTMHGKRKKQIQSVEHGENLVGSRIKVWWPEDSTYYEGTVKSFESHNKMHKVWYDNGDDELLDFNTQKWELVDDVPEWFHLLTVAYKLQLEGKYQSNCPNVMAQSAEHGGNLVGSRIKVWWPADESYYEGVMESFDRSKMKHKVLYDYGDEDVVNLNQRQWKLLEDVSAIEPVPD
ncbi:phospholipase-like protein, partial [Tanacetum coccineum]